MRINTININEYNWTQHGIWRAGNLRSTVQSIEEEGNVSSSRA